MCKTRHARASRANALRKGPLGNQVEFRAALQHHLFEQLVFAHVGSDMALDLPVREKQAQAGAVDSGIIADRREVFSALGGNCADQVLWHAAQSESAEHDSGAVEDVPEWLLPRSKQPYAWR